MRPTFIGIGAAKAATTWIYKCLDEHPEVFMAPGKEVEFFGSAASIDHRIAEYESHFAGAAGARAIGEISTKYLSSIDAPAQVLRHLPDVKLFVSLRNPLEQLTSHYWHLRRQNFHHGDASDLPKDFAEAVQRFPERLVEPCLYAKHLARWRALFPSSQLHVVLYDDIQHDPRSVLSGLFRFVGVDPDFVPALLTQRGSDVRQGVSPRNESADQVHRWLYGALNFHVYRPLKNLIGVERANDLKEAFRIRQVMERVFFKRGYEEFSKTERKLAASLCAGEIDDLERLLGVSLPQWRATFSDTTGTHGA